MTLSLKNIQTKSLWYVSVYIQWIQLVALLPQMNKTNTMLP